jgi:hypothetical protein
MSAALAPFAPLSPAEERLTTGIGSGLSLQLGNGDLPGPGDAARRIRADLLRLLLLGGADLPPMHTRGLRLIGALIVGQLDLQNARIGSDVQLIDCRFDEPVVLQSAAIDSLFLDGSSFPGLAGRRLEARGNLYIRRTMITHAVDLRGARIGGEMVLDGSSIAAPDDIALELSYVVTRGDLTLRSCAIDGRLKAWGISVAGDMIFLNATIACPGGMALSGNAARIGGDLDLRASHITGSTAFVGGRFATDVLLDGARFEAPGAIAVDLNRATIGGALFLRRGAEVIGALSLNGARVGALVDETASWPKPGDLLLNRFVYDGFLASPVDARSRLRWLALQDPPRWGEDFWPQPYEQLGAILSAMGHQDDARAVLFRKEQLQRRARRRRAKSRLTRYVLRLKDGALAATVGYGLYPLTSFVWLFGFWLAGVGFLSLASSRDELRPNAAVMLRSPEWTLCATPTTDRIKLPSIGQERSGLAAPGQSQLACFRSQAEARALPAFNPWVFSAEAVVPGLEAGQRIYWSPDTRFSIGYAAKIFEYVQRLAGYTIGLLAVAGFSGLVKSK